MPGPWSTPSRPPTTRPGRRPAPTSKLRQRWGPPRRSAGRGRGAGRIRTRPVACRRGGGQREGMAVVSASPSRSPTRRRCWSFRGSVGLVRPSGSRQPLRTGRSVPDRPAGDVGMLSPRGARARQRPGPRARRLPRPDDPGCARRRQRRDLSRSAATARPTVGRGQRCGDGGALQQLLLFRRCVALDPTAAAHTVCASVATQADRDLHHLRVWMATDGASLRSRARRRSTLSSVGSCLASAPAR